MRVAETKLIEVSLQVLRRNGVIRPVKGPLKLRPKAVNGLCVDGSTDVLPDRVLDHLMDESHSLGSIVDAGFIRGQNGPRRGVVPQKRHDNGRPGMGDDLRFDLPATFHDPENGSLSLRADAALAAAMLPSDVGFIGFNHPAQRAAVFGHEKPNLAANAPSALVGDAKLSLNFLRRDPVLCRGKQKNGMEPGHERRRGLVKYRVRRGAKLMAAPGANVRFSAMDVVETILMGALVARRAPRMPIPVEELQTRLVVRELPTEVLDGVGHLIGSFPVGSFDDKFFVFSITKCLCFLFRVEDVGNAVVFGSAVLNDLTGIPSSWLSNANTPPTSSPKCRHDYRHSSFRAAKAILRSLSSISSINLCTFSSQVCVGRIN